MRGRDVVRRWTGLVGALVTVGALLVPLPAASQAASASTAMVLGGPAAVPASVAGGLAPCVDTVDRVAGADRFATAVALARRGPEGGPVFLASGRSFADGLAAGPVVAAAGGVLLLTEPDHLPEATRDELRRRGAERVVVLGGPAAVSADVADELRDLGLSPRRVGGADRYATAAELATAFPTGVDRVVVATGRAFADALAIGPVAARDGAPVLLVEPDRVPGPVVTQLRRLAPREVVVLGGTSAVSASVATRLRELTGVVPRRVAGADRYATATAIARTFVPDPVGTVAVTTGREFADALAAGPVLDGALLLADRDLAVDTADEVVRQTGSDCEVVTARPDPVEGLTLGPSSTGGSTLRVEVGEGAAVLTSPTDTGALLRAPSTGDQPVRLAYPAPTAGRAGGPLDPDHRGDGHELVARQAWRGGRPDPPDGVTLAWQYLGDSADYRSQVDAAPGLTVTAPFRYALGSDGTLDGSADPAFITSMHDRGIDVWPTIHTCGETCVHGALADPARRASLAVSIADDARAAGADGVNVDIEGFRDADRDAVTSFVAQLSERVQPGGGHLVRHDRDDRRLGDAAARLRVLVDGSGSARHQRVRRLPGPDGLRPVQPTPPRRPGRVTVVGRGIAALPAAVQRPGQGAARRAAVRADLVG